MSDERMREGNDRRPMEGADGGDRDKRDIDDRGGGRDLQEEGASFAPRS